MKKNLILLLVAMLVISACNLPAAKTGTPYVNEANRINTVAAKTVEAIATQLAAPVIPQATPTFQQPLGTPLVVVSTPTLTPLPQPTRTITPVPVPCDRAEMVSETIPDGTEVAAGAAFTKTWTLKNTGTCTWNSGYAVVFFGKEAMNGPAARQLTTGTVAPGQEVQISLDLKAPARAGTFRGEWKLRNASSVLFGLGSTASQPFWVEIAVKGSEYNFVDNMCASGVEWRSGTGVLPCPGNETDANGFVKKVDNPKMETGDTDDEPALWTNPQFIDNGTISGKYPAIIITAGSRFKTVLGCLADAPNCNVKFQLNARIDGAAETTLAEWTETSDGKFTRVDLDLSSLAGKSVVFVLVVKANGPSDQDRAFWLLPRIVVEN